MNEDTPAPLAIPGYEILETLGHGGMGQVFRARQESLDREVAIKVLRTDLAASGWLPERFEREARTMASLRHPHLVTVHDCLRLSDDRIAIVMEFVRDGALRQHLAESPNGLPLASSLLWIREIADGLRAAHEEGIIHRDVKPENILIDEAGHARVSDFGMAFSSEPAATRYTQTGVALGTVGYMAPEQLRGVAVDARADVYSLGVVLYEMLTGRLPQGSFTPARELRPEVPALLDRFILSCLRPDPESRPASMTAVLAALRALDDQDSSSHLSRRRWLAAGLTAAGAGAAWWFIHDRSGRPGHGQKDTVAPAAPPPSDDAWRRIVWPENPTAAAIRGRWRVENGRLQSGEEVCILPLVQEMPPAWELRTSFRRLRGRYSIEFFFRHRNGVGSCLLDGWSNHLGGVQCLSGHTLQDGGGFEFELINEQAYEWTIEMRPDRVRMWIDGVLKNERLLGSEPLTVAQPWDWNPGPAAAALSIGSYMSATRWEWIDWRPVKT